MRHVRAVLAVGLAGLAGLAAPMTAQACQRPAPLRIEAVLEADAVVIGRVSDYRRTISEQHRLRRLERERHEPPVALAYEPFDGAHFTLTVDRVVSGQSARRVQVEWNPNFSFPRQIVEGPFLVAMVRTRPGSASQFMIMNRPCSEPLMFRTTSSKASAALRVLAGEPAYPPEPPEPPKPSVPPKRALDPLLITAPPEPPPPAPTEEPPFGYEGEPLPRPWWKTIPILYSIMLGGGAVGLLAAAVALIWRRRRARPDARGDDDGM